MCGISGIYRKNGGMLSDKESYSRALVRMNQAQEHRGPDGKGIYLTDCCGLAHVRLSIQDLHRGSQPMHYIQGEKHFSIVYNGEIYNTSELRGQLQKEGVCFETNCDTEVILKGYAVWGEEVAKKLNGIYAFAVWQEQEKKLFLCRDRLGVKPLFYIQKEDEVIFASEIKAIFAYDSKLARIGREGLCELLALGPAHTCKKTVYEDITEVEPAGCYVFDKTGMKESTYWSLEAREHEDTKEQTIEKTAFLIRDAIKKQLLSDVPICTFLSGGLDSSIVSSVAQEHLKQRGVQLSTYSFDFEGNDTYFEANSFQPTQDAPFAKEMAQVLQTKHRVLVCSNEDLFQNLYHAMRARDYPCMADVESSMLYFCKQVGHSHKVTLTGECADEIFGGYPWFYRQDMFEREDFPWSYDMEARTALWKGEWIEELKPAQYSREAYTNTIEETPRLEGESATEARRRELSYLNLRWFMATLLERMDRTSMYHGLEARVPFADHRIVEYLYNVPWQFKYMDNMEKGLLRHAAKGLLPDSVLFRKKSPYPKTYHPAYENLLKTEFHRIINTSGEPVLALIDSKKAREFMETPMSYGKPWYGQLMAGPQMLAYFIQVNMWMKEYGIVV